MFGLLLCLHVAFFMLRLTSFTPIIGAGSGRIKQKATISAALAGGPIKMAGPVLYAERDLVFLRQRKDFRRDTRRKRAQKTEKGRR